MTADELELHDKRQSAIHEAGHTVIGTVHGSLYSPWLERSGTSNSRLEKTWIGHADNVLGGSDERVRALIGVAGAVADSLDLDPDITAQEIVERWECDPNSGPSPADRSIISSGGWERRLEAVATVRAILAEHWQFLESIVVELIEHDRVSMDRVLMLFALHKPKKKK